MSHAFQQNGHVEIGEIGEVQTSFITAELFSKYCFQVFVEGRNTTDYNNVSAVRLQSQSHVESLRRIEYCPATRKVGIDRGIVRLLFARPTKNDRNVRKIFLVCVDHERKGGGSKNDDQIRLTILIFANV